MSYSREPILPLWDHLLDPRKTHLGQGAKPNQAMLQDKEFIRAGKRQVYMASAPPTPCVAQTSSTAFALHSQRQNHAPDKEAAAPLLNS